MPALQPSIRYTQTSVKGLTKPRSKSGQTHAQARTGVQRAVVLLLRTVLFSVVFRTKMAAFGLFALILDFAKRLRLGVFGLIGVCF